MAEPMHFEARGLFAVSPEELWPLVSDTERLNQAIGLPAMRLRGEPLDTGGARVVGEHPAGSAVLSGLAQILRIDPRRVRDERLLRLLPSFAIVRWEEHPFEWQSPHRYSVFRDYFWSPLGLFPFRTFRGGVELRLTEDGGTEAIAFADVVPRNPQGALLTRLLLGPRSCRRVVEQCRTFERYLRGEIADPFPGLLHSESHIPAAPVPNGRDFAAPAASRSTDLAHGWARLVASGVAHDLADRMRHHLATAPDEDVVKMRPFELADRWGLDRRDTLVAFLRGTTAGLVEMTWEVLCPVCRVSKASYNTLSNLESHAYCDVCNVTFDATIDRQVEMRFTVAEALRHVEDRRFCSGGPMNAPHVLGQIVTQPGEASRLVLDLAPGTYRIRSPQSAATAVLEVGGQTVESATSMRVTSESILPSVAALAAGRAAIEARNDTGGRVLLVVEDPSWPDTAATASLVGTIQEFRDLFGAEVLAPGLQLAIQRLAFLFTDLTGSTAMYQTLGQARAFRIVQDHFEILRPPVERHRGAIVKTIGDAVMATFPSGANAVAAALEMQREICRLATEGAIDATRLLKIGVHEGPCIAVTANGRLDYFGTTVNMAARVEHESRGGELVITSDVWDDPSVRQAIDLAGAALEPDEVPLRGIREPVRLYRLTQPAAIAAGQYSG